MNTQQKKRDRGGARSSGMGERGERGRREKRNIPPSGAHVM